jgi:membrane associated rhomboid family serine protease
VLPLKDDLPTRHAPVTVVVLIAANVAAFLWQRLGVGMEASVQMAGLVPAALLGAPREALPPLALPAPLTVLTSMFLHGSFAHILGNMWFLWIFGNNVEDAFGRGRFLAFYLFAGVAAAAAQTAGALAAGGRDLFVPMVGASGAISGVLAAYFLMFPRARVLTLVPIFIIIRIIALPAWVFLGGWFLVQLLSELAGAQGGVAFLAHIGGFLAGLVATPFLRPRWRSGAGW